jgi:lipopolysaccharide/colanic/teichoic acid biosynthesis glycosyltransferase
MTVRTYDHVKRILDIVASAAGLLITAPIQLGVALAVRCSSAVLSCFGSCDLAETASCSSSSSSNR